MSPVEYDPLPDSALAVGSNLYDPDTDREVTVVGRLVGDAGAAFLVVTLTESPNGGGFGQLVSEAHARDTFEARPNLTPEQREERRAELQRELDALKEDDRQDSVSPVASVTPAQGPVSQGPAQESAPVVPQNSGTDSTVTTDHPEGV